VHAQSQHYLFYNTVKPLLPAKFDPDRKILRLYDSPALVHYDRERERRIPILAHSPLGFSIRDLGMICVACGHMHLIPLIHIASSYHDRSHTTTLWVIHTPISIVLFNVFFVTDLLCGKSGSCCKHLSWGKKALFHPQ
jgi:hypothetical protein